jgi:hypothetical protein
MSLLANIVYRKMVSYPMYQQYRFRCLLDRHGRDPGDLLRRLTDGVAKRS